MVDDAGHRAVPHTADTIVEAWGPSLASCLAEAARGMVAQFVEVPDQRGVVRRSFQVAGPDVDRLLAALLEEIIFVVDAEGLVPCEIDVEMADDQQARGTMSVVPVRSAIQVGSAPKSVSLSGLRVTKADGAWSCRVVVDI